MNRIFKQLAAVLLALVLLAGTALAALPDRLIPGGQAIGLQLQTDGVSIVELAQDNPCAREAGLRRGDVIRAIDGERVSTVRQVTAAVSASGGQALTIRYERGGKAAETAVQPQRTADGWRLGVFVRDSITGIGTVTYYDPENGTFGALGHGVCERPAPAAQRPCPARRRHIGHARRGRNARRAPRGCDGAQPMRNDPQQHGARHFRHHGAAAGRFPAAHGRRRAGPHRQRDDPLQRFRHGDARICRADRLRRAG